MNEVLHSTQLIALNSPQGEVPEWINVIPAGPGVEGIDGRRWTLSDANAVIETFRRRGNKLPVDVEHATQIKGALGEAAPAMGYVTELDSREGGLWARIDWNSAGTDLMTARSYAHCSPVFAHDPAGEIKRLVSIGLTNNPNLDLIAFNRASSGSGDDTPTKERRSMDKAVAEALGLNADASTASILAAINSLKERETTALNQAKAPDPAKFVPKADYEIAMNKVRAFETAAEAQKGKDAEAVVDAAIEAGRVAPSSREYHLAACKAEGGLDAFRAAFDNAPAIVDSAKAADKIAANRAGSHGLSEEEIAVCKATGMSAEDFVAAKKEQEA